jgi:hypothetical protein
MQVMTLRPFLATIFVLAIAGCAVGAIHLYPIESPTAGQPSNPILNGTIVYAPGAATLSFRLPNGEKFSGPCTFGSPAGVNDDLKAAWDSVYGQGDYISHVVGSPTHCTATLTGNQGTVFHVESYGGPQNPIKGIAQNGNGNLYKLGS